ncbi:MAG: glycoside hydrolase family 99-like domain-containing protein [Clostridia bacterium]|nr:glycoside hydrolase family 99-like domain-containing protein [Clostridia bacterium]
MKQNIDVAAYIWPAYTGKEPRTRLFWPEGIGEWETVQKALPKFEGHKWPRKPLWGYQDEADPSVMEMQIEEALAHGVNTFIYDWYWFDGRPFLEQCLNDGFLKAKNNEKMKFFLMWANHDANYLWDRRNASEDYRATVIWQGKTDLANFYVIGKRWLDQYFTLPNYYKIDGKPLISIYDLANFINSFGSVETTRDAMLWLDEEAKKYGLPGVHFQVIHQGARTQNLSGIDAEKASEDLIAELPFSSITNYQYAHMVNVDRPFCETTPDVIAEWNRLHEKFDATYYPHVSIGWDNNPRHLTLFKPNILRDNTPDAFREALREAKKFAEATGVSMVTVNSWNEWTEGSYLLPDDLYGYGYLDAVKQVFLEDDQ